MFAYFYFLNCKIPYLSLDNNNNNNRDGQIFPVKYKYMWTKIYLIKWTIKFYLITNIYTTL